MASALAAGLLAAAWALVHLVVGGRQVARPLREAAGLPEVVRVTAWMTWHMTTASLAVMAGLLLAGGALRDASLAWAGTALAAGIAAAGIVAAPALGTSWRRLPQGWLFVPVAALGALGAAGL